MVAKIQEDSFKWQWTVGKRMELISYLKGHKSSINLSTPDRNLNFMGSSFIVLLKWVYIMAKGILLSITALVRWKTMEKIQQRLSLPLICMLRPTGKHTDCQLPQGNGAQPLASTCIGWGNLFRLIPPDSHHSIKAKFRRDKKSCHA